MSAIILNGKKLAEKIKNELAIKIKDLGIKPQLAVIRVEMIQPVKLTFAPKQRPAPKSE